MSAPDSPTGLPKLDPNDRERDIVDSFNRLVDMIEARQPSYFSTPAERDATWGTPGIYDRPQTIIGGTWRMWDGDHWALVTSTDSPYSWTPYLYTGDLVPFSNPNNTMYTSACAHLPISDNLTWLKFAITLTDAGCKYLAGRTGGELIQSSLPAFQFDASNVAGGTSMKIGGQWRTGSWFSSSTRQMGFAHGGGPLTANSFAYQAGDTIRFSAVVAV